MIPSLMESLNRSAFRDGNRQNRFKDETCTYCNKKCHTETICFAKHDDDKMTKMAKTIASALAGEISATNKKAMNFHFRYS